jgi:hypothetical protein
MQRDSDFFLKVIGVSQQSYIHPLVHQASSSLQCHTNDVEDCSKWGGEEKALSHTQCDIHFLLGETNILSASQTIGGWKTSLADDPIDIRPKGTTNGQLQVRNGSNVRLSRTVVEFANGSGVGACPAPAPQLTSGLSTN